jgi:hypothetical protein
MIQIAVGSFTGEPVAGWYPVRRSRAAISSEDRVLAQLAGDRLHRLQVDALSLLA